MGLTQEATKRKGIRLMKFAVMLFAVALALAYTTMASQAVPAQMVGTTSAQAKEEAAETQGIMAKTISAKTVDQMAQITQTTQAANIDPGGGAVAGFAVGDTYAANADYRYVAAQESWAASDATRAFSAIISA